MAVLQPDDPLGLDGDGVVVGDEHHGVPRGVELLQHGQHLPARVGVQGAGGLVGQDHRRVPGQGPGDGHPLLLAAGELHGLVIQFIAQSHHLQGDPRPFVPLRLGDAGVHQGHLHILLQGQLGQQVVLLKDEAQHLVADGGQLVFVHLAHVLAVQQIGAGGGHVQAADDVHAGGFAGAGLAHDGHELPLLNLKGDAVRRLDRGVTHLVVLAHLPEFDQTAHQKPPGPPLGIPPPGIPPLEGMAPPAGMVPIIMALSELPEPAAWRYATVSPSCRPERISM